jgi:hypothetical protein
LVPSANHVAWLIEFLINRTLPSAKSTFTPPGWLLSARENSTSSVAAGASVHQDHGYTWEFGVTTVLNNVSAAPPRIHQLPPALLRFAVGHRQPAHCYWLPLPRGQGASNDGWAATKNARTPGLRPNAENGYKRAAVGTGCGVFLGGSGDDLYHRRHRPDHNQPLPPIMSPRFPESIGAGRIFWGSIV